jgi:hypothetical protein
MAATIRYRFHCDPWDLTWAQWMDLSEAYKTIQEDDRKMERSDRMDLEMKREYKNAQMVKFCKGTL